MSPIRKQQSMSTVHEVDVYSIIKARRMLTLYQTSCVTKTSVLEPHAAMKHRHMDEEMSVAMPPIAPFAENSETDNQVSLFFVNICCQLI